MINKLRFKFIKITGISVLIVLIAIIASVNIVNLTQNNRSADSITQMILDGGGVLKKFNRLTDGTFPDELHQGIVNERFEARFHNMKEISFSSRYFSVFLSGNMEIMDYNMDNIASVSSDEIETLSMSILSKGKSTGWYKNYRYRLGIYENGYLLVVLEATATKSSVLTVLSITVSIGLAAYLIVMLLVTLLSKRVIAPIAETYEKQKQFITDASHELKTPLTVISANSEILSLTYGENEWCEGIEKQTESMRGLIGQMIQMAKLDEDEQVLSFAPFSLSDAVYDTSMSFSPIAEKKGIHLEINVKPGLEMNGDEGAFRQVISVLSDNAVKYCDADGKITVNAYKDKGHIVICISNTFSKVDELDAEKIFERFYRADKARAASHSYGLGLSIARSIVEKHKGTLTAEKAYKALEMRIRF